MNKSIQFYSIHLLSVSVSISVNVPSSGHDGSYDSVSDPNIKIDTDSGCLVGNVKKCSHLWIPQVLE